MAKARATRLAVDDWIQAGYAIIAEEGIKSLKVDRLCTRLGVTKGSFYWHFADIASYRVALVDAWGASRDEERRHFGTSTGMPARERLSQMMTAVRIGGADRRPARGIGRQRSFHRQPAAAHQTRVDVLAGHVVFDYDTSRELAGALTLGMKVSRTAMV
jgi:AcrR family transcriptional regulator